MATIWVEARAKYDNWVVVKWTTMMLDPDDLDDVRRLGDELVKRDTDRSHQDRSRYTIEIRERDSHRPVITFTPRG